MFLPVKRLNNSSKGRKYEESLERKQLSWNFMKLLESALRWTDLKESKIKVDHIDSGLDVKSELAEMDIGVNNEGFCVCKKKKAVQKC